MAKKIKYKKRQIVKFNRVKFNMLIRQTGLNNQEFADLAGIKRPIVSKLINGLSLSPSATTIIKIADLLKIKDIRELFQQH